MRPILFEKNTTDFSTNGKGRLSEATSCIVTEERNGVYDLEIIYPVDGKHYDELCSGACIGVIHDDNKDVQGFDIYARSAPFEGHVTFYAHHVSYRLRNIILQPFTATSCADAISKIVSSSANVNIFTFETDKDVDGSFTLDHPESVRAVLCGQEGSFLDRYGKGDYEFDNFHVKLWTNRGANRGVSVKYGKNLIGGNQEINSDNLFNAIAPYWKKENEDGTITTVFLDGIYVHRDTVTNPIPVSMDFSSEFESAPTQDQLRTRAIKYLDDNEPWAPSENVKLDYSELWGGDKKILLCDKITASYPDLGLDAVQQKVIKLVYDAIGERVTSVELGKPYKTYAEEISDNTASQLNTLRHTVNSKVSTNGVEEVVLTSASIQTRIDGIVSAAIAEYATTTDLETLRRTLTSEFAQLSNEVGIRFTSTESRVSTLETKTEQEFNTISTFFKFTPSTQQIQGGLYIGESVNEVKIKIAPDGVYYYTCEDEDVSEETALSYYKYNIFVAGNTIQIGAYAAPVHWQFKTLPNGDLALDRF